MQINIQHIDFFFPFFVVTFCQVGVCSLGLPGGIRVLLQSGLMAQALSQVDTGYCLQ